MMAGQLIAHLVLTEMAQRIFAECRRGMIMCPWRWPTMQTKWPKTAYRCTALQDICWGYILASPVLNIGGGNLVKMHEWLLRQVTLPDISAACEALAARRAA